MNTTYQVVALAGDRLSHHGPFATPEQAHLCVLELIANGHDTATVEACTSDLI